SGKGAESKNIKVCDKCHGSGKEVSRRKTPFGVVEMVGACSKCDGLGEIILTVCDMCKGAKYIKKEKQVTIKVSPPFIPFLPYPGNLILSPLINPGETLIVTCFS
ncbi:zinc finger-like domain-containing protein, partial [Mycoplasmopsis bovis]|uniref:zinc finger-like domain-containing protein n=1 Tax=Mycoplasmopsis bovis TaxID=28903 RepID=UPI003D2E9ACC